jgi:hypothetical protein
MSTAFIASRFSHLRTRPRQASNAFIILALFYEYRPFRIGAVQPHFPTLQAAQTLLHWLQSPTSEHRSHSVSLAWRHHVKQSFVCPPSLDVPETLVEAGQVRCQIGGGSLEFLFRR